MAIVKAKAYIPSTVEYDALEEKYPAFAGGELSEKAKKQGAWESIEYKNKGFYFLRTPIIGSSSTIHGGHVFGVRARGTTSLASAGLRVALGLIYNPKSSLVRGCRNLKLTSKGWNGEKEVYVTSTAPVVKYGGNDYIWTNKEECENGSAKIMSLISLDLIERAVPFAREFEHNDYAKAEELRAQCERVAFKNATMEELKMAVEATMSSEDGYKSVKYNIPHKEDADESENEIV